MTKGKRPAPHANAESPAKSKLQQHQSIISAVDREADPAAIWFARRFALPTALARLLATLASRGRALQ